MTPEELVTVILAVLGVLIQLAIMYVPAVYKWYDESPNKGVITLGIDVVIGVIYFGLGCVPLLAGWLKILLACSVDGLFVLLQAIYIIALSQQLTYNFLKNKASALRVKRLSRG
jgi:hypothetical protein